MEKYKVVNPVVLPSGSIQLDEKQAKARSHQIKKVKGDVYEIMTPISFKAGEVVGFETLPKVHKQNLEIVGQKTKAKK